MDTYILSGVQFDVAWRTTIKNPCVKMIEMCALNMISILSSVVNLIRETYMTI